MLLSAFSLLQTMDRLGYIVMNLYTTEISIARNISFYEHYIPFHLPSTNDSFNTSKTLDYDLPFLDTHADHMNSYTPKHKDHPPQTSQSSNTLMQSTTLPSSTQPIDQDIVINIPSTNIQLSPMYPYHKSFPNSPTKLSISQS